MWEVQEDKQVRRFNDTMLRQLLREGELSGAELARRDGGDWRPLYESELFRDAVPHAGDPKQAVVLRTLQPLLMHGVAYVAVNVFLLVQTVDLSSWDGPQPQVALFWGIGLVGHMLRVARTLGPIVSTRGEVSGPVATPAALPDPDLRASFHDVAEALISDLGGVEPELEAEVRKLEEAGAALSSRIRALRGMVHAGDLERLRQEAVRLEGRLAGTVDARDAEVAQRELASLEERIAVTEDATAALARLEAEERALTHQIEGLRLALWQTKTSPEQSDDMLARVRELRARTEAEAELDAALAMARERD